MPSKRRPVGGTPSHSPRCVPEHVKCTTTVSQQIGGALGLAVLATLATSRTDEVMTSRGSALPDALTEGFQLAFLGGAVIAALGFVATLVLIRTRDSRAHIEMSPAEA